ncbi:MAG: ferrochelatase [Gammaproteobacteria bacterium]|nr:ferrochelatase [Gammaproteobacteria bacterium]
MKKGVLLVNLGTPNSATPRDVRHFLAQFLSDRRVVDLPALFRYVLLYAIILPFRSKRTSASYQQIWTVEGSPLLTHCQALTEALQHKLGKHIEVRLGMRYGHPSITDALQALSSCDHVTILPLYPQYASASTGSSLEAIFNYLSKQDHIPSLKIIHAFYDHPAFIHAEAELITPYLPQHDFVLFSYHGLPERHIAQSGCKKSCDPTCPPHHASKCYRSQCYTTSALLAAALQLPSHTFDTAFQSRFGATPWIKPYTVDYLEKLAQLSIKRLLIVCPSFTADCLETLEEIGETARKQWFDLGGERFTLVPSLNASPMWLQAIADIIN